VPFGSLDQTVEVRSRQQAWVAWNPLDRTYSGYVASLDEHGREAAQVDYAPEGLDFDEVMRWATEAASSVFVRPHWDSGTTYWAGDDGDHSAHPHLDRTRAGEPADEVVERPISISGVIANCADCDWKGTFTNQAELLSAYAAHARDRHGGPDHA
jgi:hypothetical protein